MFLFEIFYPSYKEEREFKIQTMSARQTTVFVFFEKVNAPPPLPYEQEGIQTIFPRQSVRQQDSNTDRVYHKQDLNVL